MRRGHAEYRGREFIQFHDFSFFSVKATSQSSNNTCTFDLIFRPPPAPPCVSPTCLTWWSKSKYSTELGLDTTPPSFLVISVYL